MRRMELILSAYAVCDLFIRVRGVSGVRTVTVSRTASCKLSRWDLLVAVYVVVADILPAGDFGGGWGGCLVRVGDLNGLLDW